ncbi:MAG: HU family DNA-binding protein [Fusobacterium sp.]|nr:HU family DNA-binding protein [Fusobacterium sp.]
MDKKNFINLYSQLSETKLYKQDAVKDVEILLETVTELLEKGETVKFLNVGSFTILERKPRVISNPATRERMEIYPKKTIKFIPSKKIQEKLK